MREFYYEYLAEGSKRGDKLFLAIYPYLLPDDVFLDIDCGYSPMAGPILDAGYSLTGFDINQDSTSYLKERFSKGKWYRTSDTEAEFFGCTVFLLLGITTPLKKYVNAYKYISKTFLESVDRLLAANNPRVVMAEAAVSTSPLQYEAVMELLQRHGYEQAVPKTEYDAGMKRATRRYYAIHIKAV